MPKTLKGLDVVTAFRNSSKGQVVLVLQGGGALGAYQVGVYQALHETGIKLNWIIGTSIGAINAGLIADNTPERRLDVLQEFRDACRARGSGTTCRLGPGFRT
jgi:NTE family protein